MTDWDKVETAWRGHEFFTAWLIERMKPRIILEIGSYKGYSTHALAKPNIGKVITIDKENHGQAENLKDFKNVKCIIGDSKEVVKTFTDYIDILHIDGSHEAQSVVDDLTAWLPKMRSDGVLLMHDCFNPGTPAVLQVFSQIKFGEDGSLTLFKRLFLHAQGLGIVTTNLDIVYDIDNKYKSSILNEDSMRYVFWYIHAIIESYIKAKEDGK